MPWLLCLLLSVPPGTCHLDVLGDSNSGPERSAMWPEELDLAPAWELHNRAWGGMTAGEFLDSEGNPITHPFTGEPFHARFHLDRLLEEDAPDVLILALGTNDLRGGHPPAQVQSDILALKRHAEEVRPGITVFIALIPPLFHMPPAVNSFIFVTNMLLRVALPPERIIDFHVGVTEQDMWWDGLHMSAKGQAKRVAAATLALAPFGITH